MPGSLLETRRPCSAQGRGQPGTHAQGLTGDRWVQGGDDAAPFNPEESRPWRSESPPLGDEEGIRGAPWRRLHRLQDVKGNKTWSQPPTSSEASASHLHHREANEKPWVMVKVQGGRAQKRSGPRPARACAGSGSALSITLGDHACMPALGVTMHRSKDGLSGPGGGKPVSFPGQGALASWGGRPLGDRLTSGERADLWGDRPTPGGQANPWGDRPTPGRQADPWGDRLASGEMADPWADRPTSKETGRPPEDRPISGGQAEEKSSPGRA